MLCSRLQCRRRGARSEPHTRSFQRHPFSWLPRRPSAATGSAFPVRVGHTIHCLLRIYTDWWILKAQQIRRHPLNLRRHNLKADFCEPYKAIAGLQRTRDSEAPLASSPTLDITAAYLTFTHQGRRWVYPEYRRPLNVSLPTYDVPVDSGDDVFFGTSTPHHVLLRHSQFARRLPARHTQSGYCVATKRRLTSRKERLVWCKSHSPFCIEWTTIAPPVASGRGKRLRHSPGSIKVNMCCPWFAIKRNPLESRSTNRTAQSHHVSS
jgi:hypothetical protein